jgi:DNA-directed RNA polymerase subunit beta'
MDCIITERDDARRDGIWKEAIYEGDQEIVPLRDRIEGRCSSDDVLDPQKPDEILIHNERS